MKLAEIEAFVSVLETGSLIRASTRLNLSQPAITRRIQQLEEGLGVTLLDRSAKPIKATTEGNEVYQIALKFLAAGNELKRVGARRETNHRLSIGIAPYWSTFPITALADYLKPVARDRDLVVVFDTSQRLLERLREKDIDAAVICSLATPEDLEPRFVRKIGEFRMAAVASRSAPLPEELDLIDVGQVGWVMNLKGCFYRKMLGDRYAEAGVPLRINSEAFRDDIRIDAIAQGGGVGIVCPTALKNHPKAGALRTLSFRDLDLTTSLHYVSNAPSVLHETIVGFFETLTSKAGADRPKRPLAAAMPAYH